jgi:hypothetical protein
LSITASMTTVTCVASRTIYLVNLYVQRGVSHRPTSPTAL